MKLFRHIVVLLVAPVAFSLGMQPIHAVTSSATVSATIEQFLTVENSTGLDFGSMNVNAIAGTVAVDVTGTRVATGGVILNTTGGGSPARFLIQGIPNATFSVSLPPSLSITDNLGNAIMVNNFVKQPSTVGVLDGSGSGSIVAGATLNIDANQAIGSYAGIMDVVINYN